MVRWLARELCRERLHILVGVQCIGHVREFAAAETTLNPLPRALVALAATVVISAGGYVAFIASIHKSTPVLTAVQWLALPVLSIVAASDSDHGELFYWLAVAAGGVLWFIVLFNLLPHRLRTNSG